MMVIPLLTEIGRGIFRFKTLHVMMANITRYVGDHYT